MAGIRIRVRVRGPLAYVTFALLAVLLLTAVFGPLFLHGRAEEFDVGSLQAGASAAHPFGTDALGRDVLARTIEATRLSLWLALITVTIGVVCGAIVGSVPVVLGRRAGRAVVAGLNLMVAFPGLLLALFLAMIFGVGARGAVLSMAVAFVPSFARLTHTTASGIASADYVSAARLLGTPRRLILRRHILPNIAEPLIVNATSQVGAALLSISALSYLGFGVQPPSYDWGRMLADGLPFIYTNPAAALAPCIAIVLAGLAFVLAGELLTQILGDERADRALPAMPTTAVEPAGSAPGTEPAGDFVMRVSRLRVTVPGDPVPFSPVLDLDLRLMAGEIVGVVGESGSGKSLTATAIGHLTGYPNVVSCTSHVIAGVELGKLDRAARERLLGTSVAMVFQDPMSALNPTLKVGRQLAEISEVHQGTSRRVALARAIDRLRAVRISAPEVRAGQYPLEFSGGMRQRAAIAMGLMADPVLIIADEPTTALDVTVQKEVLALLRRVAEETGAAVMLISHDIAVVSEIASRVLVMYAGRIVEELPVGRLVDGAAHPYTRALIASIPDMTTDRSVPLATIPGRPPNPSARPDGCAFAPRCARADSRCREHEPELEAAGHGGRVACFHPIAEAPRPGDVRTDDTTIPARRGA